MVIYSVELVFSLLIFLPLWGLIEAVVAKIITTIAQVITSQVFFYSELKPTLANSQTIFK